MTRTNVCVFAAQEDLETMQAFAQVSSEIWFNLNGVVVKNEMFV